MTTYQKAAIIIAMLTLVMSSNISAVYASPAETEQLISNFFQEEWEDFLETFEDDDYNKWKKIVGENSKIVKIITREKFAQFIKARELARQGKYEESISLADELKKDILRKTKLN